MVKDGYKETEIGVIPEDWETASFDNCFKILSNNTFARNDLNEGFGTIKNIHYGDILIKFSNVIDNGKSNLPYIHENYVSKINNSFLQDGDLIIADTAEDETVGKACELIEVKQDKIVSGLHTIPCRPKVNQMFVSKWLGYYINSIIYHSQLLPYITGTKVSAISKEAIKKTVVLVPPKIEQQKIAEALSDMDNLISSLEKLIEKKKAIKQASLQKMFPKDGETVPEMRLPGFTEAWEQRKLSEMITYRNGTGHEDKQSDCGKYELINLNSVSIDGGLKPSGRFVDDASETLFENDLVMVLSDVGHGDLLGRVAIIPENSRYVLNQRVALLRPNETIYPKFLLVCINAHQKYFKLNGAGSSQLNISKDTVENFCPYVPEFLEQKEIAKYFDTLDHLIALHQRKLEKCRKIKEGMMQQLLTGKIRLI